MAYLSPSALAALGLRRLGRDVLVSDKAVLHGAGEMEFGDRCRIGPYTMIIDTPFHDVYDRLKRPEGQSTIIETDVWIGAKVSIMPGVTIGHGSVVGTGAVVSKDVPAYSVVGGVQAKVIDTLDPDKFVMPQGFSPNRDHR